MVYIFNSSNRFLFLLIKNVYNLRKKGRKNYLLLKDLWILSKSFFDEKRNFHFNPKELNF